MCDWVNDDLPYRFATSAGEIINVPVNHELSDRQIVTVQQNSADSFCDQMRDAFTLLQSEAQAGGGRMLTIQLTPYISGLPYRIGAVERLLDWLLAREAGFATLGEIAEDFVASDG
jgi:allantoinase